MSSYIDFYLKDQKNSTFCPLFSFSRSSEIYQAFESYVPYGKVSPLTLNQLLDIQHDIQTSIENYHEMITTSTQAIDFLTKCSDSLEEKMEHFYSEQNSIEGAQDEIKFQERALGLVITLQSIVAHTEWDKDINSDEVIWAGIEAGIPT